MAAARSARVDRKTGETQIQLTLNLDKQEPVSVATGVGFLDHMLQLLAFHAGMSLTVKATGDTYVDDHHTVEDVGIALGQALNTALGDKSGIARYAHAYVPLNEALGRAVIDLCGRGQLEYAVPLTAAKVGTFDSELGYEFFRALSDSGKLTLHLDLIRGHNVHHCLEVLFKATGRALGEAMRAHSYRGDVVSTKGVL